MKMFTDPRRPANVECASESITLTLLLPHATEYLAQCADHCSLCFSIKQGKASKRTCHVSFTYFVSCTRAINSTS